MDEKNKKRKTLYIILGVMLIVLLLGGTYAYFSARVTNNNISGQSLNIDSNSLRLNVTKVDFNGVSTSSVPSNNLVPAFFGLNNGNNLNVSNPTQLKLSNVQSMVQNKCVNTTEGYTGCHVWKIAISANQNIPNVNLLLGLTVNDNSASNVSVVNKNQWGYVVFTASDNDNTTGVVGSGTQDNIANGVITNLALNSANHGGPSAIGSGLVSSPTDNRIDIHNNQGLLGCNSAGDPQEVVYYLLVYVNDTDVSQNTSNNGVGDNNYVVGSYSGTLELQALGGSVKARFGTSEEETPAGTLKSRILTEYYDEDNDGVAETPYEYVDVEASTFLGLEVDESFIEDIYLNITSIYTLDHTSIPGNALYSWDASEEQNGSVMAWITGSNDNYSLYIGQVGGVKANPNSSSLFFGFYNVSEIDLSNLDTSGVTSMNYMFGGCSSLTTLDLGDNFDTSNVTDMSGMFDGCSSLTTLDLGDNFDTSNVTDMSNMFNGCSSLTTLDLGDNFDTSNVTDMGYMFIDCSSLTTLDLGDNFDTSNVTEMGFMFYGCSGLTTLDLSKFNMSSVNRAKNIFSGCSNLTTLTTKEGDEGLFCCLKKNSNLSNNVTINGSMACNSHYDATEASSSTCYSIVH